MLKMNPKISKIQQQLDNNKEYSKSRDIRDKTIFNQPQNPHHQFTDSLSYSAI